MPSIRYTVGGSYDAGNSSAATFRSDLSYFRGVQPDGSQPGDPFQISGYDHETFFATDYVREQDGSYLLPTTGGVFIDFSDYDEGLTLTGGDFGDVIRGGSGSDTLNGGDGNDILEGGGGTIDFAVNGTGDTLNGGAGIDTASYEHAGTGVTASLIAPAGNTGDAAGDVYNSIENLRGSAYADTLTGDAGRNVIEGGGGGDTIIGVGTGDLASYVHSAAAVTVNLTTGVNTGGDAQGDTLSNIENIYGSRVGGDTLTGDANANTIFAMGPNDTVDGMAGNDRIVIAGTPASVNGGDGTDTLVLRANGSATLTDNNANSNFTGFERVVVGNNTTLDMSGVDTGERIVANVDAGSTTSITGTSGNDRIYAGGGAETFNETMANFGRDVILNASANLGNETFNLSALGGSQNDLMFTAIHDGMDTRITSSANPSQDASVILRGVTATDAQEHGHFTFNVKATGPV